MFRTVENCAEDSAGCRGSIALRPQPAGDLFRSAVHNFVQAILSTMCSTALIWKH
jgi:hypothetical protein